MPADRKGLASDSSDTTDAPPTSSITKLFCGGSASALRLDGLFLAPLSSCAWLSGDRKNRNETRSAWQHPDSHEFKLGFSPTVLGTR